MLHSWCVLSQLVLLESLFRHRMDLRAQSRERGLIGIGGWSHTYHRQAEMPNAPLPRTSAGCRLCIGQQQHWLSVFVGPLSTTNHSTQTTHNSRSHHGHSTSTRRKHLQVAHYEAPRPPEASTRSRWCYARRPTCPGRCLNWFSNELACKWRRCSSLLY